MFKHGFLALRYSAPMESTKGMVSYHAVLSPPYNMEVLKTNVRNRLRKGLRECQVERIPFEKLAREGWILQMETLS
jgi:REP element-mobilizing transposase RayT